MKNIADAYVCLYIFFFHVSRFTINVQYDELGQGTVIPPINSTNKRTNIFLSPMKPYLEKPLLIYFRYISGILPVCFRNTFGISDGGYLAGYNRFELFMPDFNRSVKEGYLFYEQEVFLS